ncbi:MAG: thiosulfate oxidation carrier complex protein SoxZ [Gammaproteobacteria bacterium]
MSSIKIRTKRIAGITQIRTLIAHPMETGLRKDKKTGDAIPAHFIQELTVVHNGKIIVNSVMGSGVSKDPYFAFQLKGGEPGDKIIIVWKDNLGNTDTAESTIK